MSMEQKSAISRPYLRLDFLGDGLGAFDVAVGDHHVGTAFGGEERNLATDPAASADDESDLAGELFLGWLATNFGLFERPVLDAEGFAGRKSDVVVVDGEEVRGDAARRLAGPQCKACYRQALLRPA